MAADLKDVVPLGTPGESDAAAWLYSDQGGKLGGKPFVVGQAKRKIYGLIPVLVAKSGFFEALAGDIKSLEAISEQAPWSLLADTFYLVVAVLRYQRDTMRSILWCL